MQRAHRNIAVRRNYIGKTRIIIKGKGIFRIQRLNVVALEEIGMTPVSEVNRRKNGKGSALRRPITLGKEQTALFPRDCEHVPALPNSE